VSGRLILEHAVNAGNLEAVVVEIKKVCHGDNFSAVGFSY
jgi:hypothetical protein